MKITTTKVLATALKDYRKRNNRTQQQVADLVGIKQSTVSAFESSPDKAKVETLFKILASLGLELHLSERLAPETSSEWQEEW